MSLTFKQKIIGSLMIAALIPLAVASAVSLYLSYNNAHELATGGFEAAHDGIQNTVEEYLNTVRRQVQEQALSPLVKDALKEFSSATRNFDTSAVSVDMGALRQRYATQQQKTPNTKPGDDSNWVPTNPTTQALQYLYISKNPNPLGEKQKMTDAGDSSAWTKIHTKYHPVFRNIIDEYGYYDYFLIDADSGTVVYTNFKEIDFQSNVKSGPLADTAFSRTVRKALGSTNDKEVFFSDVESYMPSYNDPAMFIAAPIVDDGKTIGAIAFQLPTAKMNGFFQGLQKMGDTYDGYLIGDDDIFKTPQISEDGKVGDKVSGDLANVVHGAISGEIVDTVVKFNGGDGAPMLGVANKLGVEGLNWALVVGVDEAEMMATTYRQIYVLLGILAVIMMAVTAAGAAMSGALVKPVIELAQNFGTSAKKVDHATHEVTQAVHSMVAASEETATQSKVIRKNSSEAAGYVKSVATAVNELNISINDISQSIGEANALIDDAVDKANKTDGVVRNLGEAAGKINEVVSLINGLAEQTNLLALNAAIEAARAGDAGRGFAVVADEVKKLATHTSQATVDIQNQIRNIQDVTERSVTALQSVVEAIHRIRDSATTVSAAVEEQSGVAKQISQSVDDAAQRVQEVDTNMSGIEQATNDTGVAADQVNGSANEVSTSFKTLQTQVASVLEKMGIKG